MISGLKKAEEAVEKERLQLQLKALDLLLKVRLNEGAVKGGSDEDDEHPSVGRARQ